MAKNSLERRIEKQQQEANRIANQEARQKRAESIINGQPIVGSMRIMDKASEEILQIILNQYHETQNNAVSGEASLFPEMYHSSLSLEFEKLSMYGMITSAHIWLGGSWIATVTPQGVTYFEDKKKTMETMEPKNRQAVSDKEYDVFISHASQDKYVYVEKLYEALKKLKIRVFYDKEEIEWGDNWKERILRGTQKSEFAIIVISYHFFDKEWTERELEEFMKRQNESNQKIVLPLLYRVSVAKFKEHYPFLEGIHCLTAKENNIDNICIQFASLLIKRLKGQI